MKKYLLISTAIILCLAIVGIINFYPNVITKAEPDHVNLHMQWVPDTTHGPFVLGVAKGFFAEENINLELTKGQGSNRTAQMVGSENFQFGVGAGATMLEARAKGMPLVVLMVMYQKSPTAIFFRKNLNINKPFDLKGKSIAVYRASSLYQQFIAFLRKNGLSVGDMTLIDTPKKLKFQTMLQGRADSSLKFSFKGAEILSRPEYSKYGKFEYLLLSDYGVTLYDQSVLTNETTLRENPGLAKRFVAAVHRSWIYSIDHPEETVRELIKAYPQLKYEHEIKRFKEAIKLTANEDTKKNGFGHMGAKNWGATQETLLSSGKIKQKIDLDKLYTNDFLPKK